MNLNTKSSKPNIWYYFFSLPINFFQFYEIYQINYGNSYTKISISIFWTIYFINMNRYWIVYIFIYWNTYLCSGFVDDLVLPLDNGLWSCGVCEKTYKYKCDVKCHIQNTHQGDKRIQCPYCFKVSKNPTTLRVHYRLHCKGLPQRKGCQKAKMFSDV